PFPHPRASPIHFLVLSLNGRYYRLVSHMIRCRILICQRSPYFSSRSFHKGCAMRSLFAVVGLLTLAWFVSPAPATVIDTKVPIPELGGGADAIVVGKVVKVQPELAQILPTAKAPRKEHYQILEVKIDDALMGAKDASTLKVAVQCGSFGMGGA